MSIPRVGSKQSSVWKPLASQRAIVTFCWLPPESRRTWRAARMSICNASIAERTRRPSSRMLMTPQRASRLYRGEAMLSRTQRGAGDANLACVRLPLAGEDVEELVLSLAFERRDPDHLAAADREAD